MLASGSSPDAPSPTPTASTELYDPRTNTRSAGNELLEARWLHTATLLSDGKALIAGGSSSAGEGSALASVELFDEDSGEFSATTGLNVARLSHTATRLPDGRVLIVGGNDASTMLSSVEVFMPETR